MITTTVIAVTAFAMVVTLLLSQLLLFPRPMMKGEPPERIKTGIFTSVGPKEH